MECDCKPDSPCSSTSRCGEDSYFESTAKGLWLDANTLLTGLISVVGFLIFRFSQGLPALLRWPIRILCSLTGISSLWSWVTNLTKTVRGLQTLFHWLARFGRFLYALLSKLTWVPALIRAIAGVLVSIKNGLEFIVNIKQRVKGPSKTKQAEALTTSSIPVLGPTLGDQGLRVIVVGPQRKARLSLVSILLGLTPPSSSPKKQSDAAQECQSWRIMAAGSGREVTIVDTPDLLGKRGGMSPAQRAREALRSLQLVSPGPHAFLLALPCPSANGSKAGEGRDFREAADALRALAELVGEDALAHVLVVLLAQPEGWARSRTQTQTLTLSQLLEENAGGGGGLREVLSMCGQRAELVAGTQGSDGGGGGAGAGAASRIMERVVEMRALQGHYVHELQRREERIRQELLADMAHVLTKKLEGKWG